MAFLVEDGTGLAAANALAAVAAVDSFWADRGGNTVWAAFDTSSRQARIIQATDYLLTNPRYRNLRGRKKVATQRLMWPRTGATEIDGTPIADTAIPIPWAEAVSLLAPVAGNLSTMLPDLSRGGKVTSESLTGVGSVTYADDAPAGTVIQYVDGLLLPYLRPSGFDLTFDPSVAVAGAAPLPVVFDSEYFGSGAVDDASLTE